MTDRHDLDLQRSHWGAFYKITIDGLQECQTPRHWPAACPCAASAALLSQPVEQTASNTSPTACWGRCCARSARLIIPIS